MNNNIIEIEGLSKKLDQKTVLQNLSLSVPRGSVFGLLGKNGAGKTTLIKCVLGLLKPTSGHIKTLGDDPFSFREESKERIGYVPQVDRIYPWLTVRQLVDYTASFYRHWNNQLVQRLLKEWEVDEKEKVGVLSEGQAQKVSIILSLGHEPEFLIFDEPVASLDPVARRHFLKTILEIISNRDCTVFFSTHITSDLERVADRVALLKNGQIPFALELDALKDEVKRLRVMSSQPLVRDLNLKGLIHWETFENTAIITVCGYKKEVKDHLEKSLNTKVEVEDLNLEEIFLELSR